MENILDKENIVDKDGTVKFIISNLFIYIFIELYGHHMMIFNFYIK